MSRPPRTGGGVDLVDRALAAGPPVMLYQPVVDLTASARPVVGYEALARWPGLGDVTTAQLFAEGDRGGRLAELDWTCRTAALRGGLESGIDTDTALFVNVEPVASRLRPPEESRQIWRTAAERLTIVLELTERKILTEPSALLAAVDEARDTGWWIAVDDVGVNPDSLAMLEFIRPDMVKLDLTFVQRTMDAEAARTLRGVSAYCERTGALMLAEGIETEEQLERALAIGASLGQGYLFGRPAGLHPGTAPLRARRVSRIDAAPTPYQLISERRGYRIARKAVLRQLTDEIEAQAATLNDPPVVLCAVQSASRFGADVARRYSSFAVRSPMVVVFGVGMPRRPAEGTHGADIAPDDPLRDEWVLVVLGTHGAVALAAQELVAESERSVDDDRRFRYVMTQDRELVVAAGMSLLNRFVRAETGED
ncbi:EAL domain, c-di-GMP-specific phosphodiesterase class I (or its enzymatically inactive variant) [Jatrophihabitans endophyticus]|uniref:EAL domain, c-di-GMP-specific phosphodiesterase class I (Or its enzymatically inactive variant) n=1 Tax=Jatrophihabitans endophyticus TaxID=1206085 RepID=A0A1M5TXV1_9ACTN|nr:EAL domain-containing protein [Jatrophihabitans endophyticus]SHH55612.1 EAL domain, c-di-GMP-specific phosphodiesterase class I (or its enzymatically inactive variant) [Jatrophihabitans endophyticus]